MDNTKRMGEVIETSTTEFVAQCYDLYQFPPLGSLVKTTDLPVELYGIVYNATTASIEPGRRPIARGKDEVSEKGIYETSPQLSQLLRSEFSVIVTGYRKNENIYHYLPPQPAHIHGFVHLCSAEEIKTFSQSFGFLTILINAHLSIPTDELISASLRKVSEVYEDPHSFLLAAGRKLAMLLSGDLNQLQSILRKIKR
ncbi:hypothetical protein ACFLXP_04955 [Chloroflexota bacterium]